MVRICERCLNPDVNVLELEVYGARFPNFYEAEEVPHLSDYLKSYVLNNPSIEIMFVSEQEASNGVQVDFNDGHKQFFYPDVGSKSIIFRHDKNNYTFSNGGNVWHNIKIKFHDISKVITLDSRYIRGRESFPDLGKMTRLETIIAVNAQGQVEYYAEGLHQIGYNALPSSILKLTNLKDFVVDSSLLSGSAITKALPLELFNTALEVLNYGGNKLGNVNTNNFDKLPLLNSTLYEFKASNSELTIDSFPDNWSSNTLLRTVWFHGLDCTNRSLTKLITPNLHLLYIISKTNTFIGDVSGEWLNIPINNNIDNLIVLGNLVSNFKLPTNLQNATKLKYITFGHTTTSICLFSTTDQVTKWWSSWYPFIVANASMDEYAPDQKFRGITFDFRGGVVDTPVVAPTGYQKGVSNGTPTTLGEQIYVLSDQYGHNNTYTY